MLRKGTTVLDVIGQIGFDPGTEWGTGLTSTADNTLRRKTRSTRATRHGTDAFDPAVEWDGFATDTFDGLGAHPGLPTGARSDGRELEPVERRDGRRAQRARLVTFSEPVDVAANGYTLSCSSAAPRRRP